MGFIRNKTIIDDFIINAKIIYLIATLNLFFYVFFNIDHFYERKFCNSLFDFGC